MLDSRLRRCASRVLPRFLIDRLDPFMASIEREVREVAAGMAPHQVVLDAGAGESRHRQFFRRGQYVALDTAVGDPAWDYSALDVLGDLECIPLRSGSVDCVLCIVTLEHTRRPSAVVAEFSRVLRPGGSLRMVVPFLWEEHQAPHDYYRFTRYGVRELFESLPFRIERLEAVGGFFGVCARRCINTLSFLQGGWRWLLFLLLAPFFGFLFPLVLQAMDGMDHSREFTLGFVVQARRSDE